MNLSILYRGPLSSCNYACDYCPFAKRNETARELAADRLALARFVKWIGDHPEITVGVLFTPWGEALVRSWYQDALVALSRLDHVARAAIQTNLSCRLSWIDDCRKDRVALWATYHPTEISRERFVRRCRILHEKGVRLSVGVVGLKEHLPEIGDLRRELPPEIYLWVNAYKREPNYYTGAEVRFLESIDPLFPINNQRHASLGKSCRAGHTVVSVDGEGTIRRCHFIKTPIGNLYDPNFLESLHPRNCTNETCGCHIGYVHFEPLGLDAVFGDGILERIPQEPIWTVAEKGPHHR